MIADKFSETYTRLYGRTLPDTAVEIVTWRLIGSAAIPAASFDIVPGHSQQGAVEATERAVFLPEHRGHRGVAVYDRYALKPGAKLEGPMILQEPESTIVIARPATVTILDNATVSIELP